MNKTGTTGMKFHQGIAFSMPFMKLSKAEAVFWPGCALMNLDNEILERTLEILKRSEPDMGISTCCCGQPSRYLFPEEHAKRRQKLLSLINKQGVKRIYTARPNCAVELRALGCVEVIPIWKVLADNTTTADVTQSNTPCTIHDPCPMRKDAVQQQAARELIALTGAQLTEPEHTRESTICCGNFHMMRAINPEKSAVMRKRRVTEFPENTVITSYCEGCLGAFRDEGRETFHVLELLFGRSQQRGWKNRIMYTMKSK